MPLAELPTELLLQIFADLSIAAPAPSPSPPPLKSLSLTSRRFRTLTFHALFTALHITLRPSHTLFPLTTFLATHALAPTSIALLFTPHWNTHSSGLPLKKFLHQLSPTSLHLTTSRSSSSSSPIITTPEKCARWPYALSSLRHLTLTTIDDATPLKFLLLRSTPLTTLRINDGDFSRSYDTSNWWQPVRAPGVTELKAAVFPVLREVEYVGGSTHAVRFEKVVRWLAGLKALRVVRVEVMTEGQQQEEEEKVWYRPSAESMRCREARGCYTALVRGMEEIAGLERVEFLEREPWGRRELVGLEKPAGWERVSEGVWERVWEDE